MFLHSANTKKLALLELFFLLKKRFMFALDMKYSHLIFRCIFLNSYMKVLIFLSLGVNKF
jgi:hypothetical protein